MLCLSWQIFRSIPVEEVPFWANVVLGFRRMTVAELKKFPQHVFGQAFTTLKCEGSAYLPWLETRSVHQAPAVASFCHGHEQPHSCSFRKNAESRCPQSSSALYVVAHRWPGFWKTV